MPSDRQPDRAPRVPHRRLWYYGGGGTLALLLLGTGDFAIERLARAESARDVALRVNATQFVTRTEWVSDSARRSMWQQQVSDLLSRLEVRTARVDDRVSVIYCSAVPPAQRAACR